MLLLLLLLLLCCFFADACFVLSSVGTAFAASAAAFAASADTFADNTDTVAAFSFFSITADNTDAVATSATSAELSAFPVAFDGSSVSAACIASKTDFADAFAFCNDVFANSAAGVADAAAFDGGSGDSTCSLFFKKDKIFFI